MSNCPSLPLVALLLASAIAPIGSFVAAASPPNSSASLTSQPLLDPDILSMLDQVDANRISADIQTLVSLGHLPVPTTWRVGVAPRAVD